MNQNWDDYLQTFDFICKDQTRETHFPDFLFYFISLELGLYSLKYYNQIQREVNNVQHYRQTDFVHDVTN